jgi:hypothetical protein
MPNMASTTAAVEQTNSRLSDRRGPREVFRRCMTAGYV